MKKTTTKTIRSDKNITFHIIHTCFPCNKTAMREQIVLRFFFIFVLRIAAMVSVNLNFTK